MARPSSTKTIVIADKGGAKAALRKRKRPLSRIIPPQAVPDHVIADYYAAIVERFEKVVLRRVQERLLPLLRSGALSVRTDSAVIWTAAPSLPALLREVRHDAKSAVVLRTKPKAERLKADKLGTVIDDIRVAWGDIRSIKPMAELASKRVDTTNDNVFRKTMKTVLGIQPEIAEPWLAPKMKRWVKDNVDLIVTIPETYFDSIEDKVREGFRSGLRHEEIADRIEEDYLANGEEAGVAKRRAALVARDQASKLSGDLAGQRQQAVGIERYNWRSAGDQRVRLTHRERDGYSFAWDPIIPQLEEYGLTVDDPDYEGHPGRPINCRCYAEPDILGFLDSL